MCIWEVEVGRVGGCADSQMPAVGRDMVEDWL